ncbi:hypothetical protein MW290_28090 [Aquincola tertiaricarbonis]|uniref:Lipoprotein n=1 Tax=Aquincola tertiaricarbonis TaxID=391953 RepID=A0ABY4S7U0_AQUTE|nr:hypothetical protein [Aquincola tertiaricarbonis]URI09428.1 hypothetical protein MW290_28090 [Aquincola tertiaricarbonis]
MRNATPCLILALSVLSGCGTSYSLKEFSPQEGKPKSALVDIKQRAILGGAGPAGQMILCAEPSPDAMSSFASELALDAKYKEAVAATLALSQQEAASFVGLRTQTIQLLRDGMYRLCEGYMSGALTSADYAWLSRRYQRNMVALLTIEQLTRVAQVPAIAQASQGLASASGSATAIQGDLAQLNQSRAKLVEESAQLEAELASAQALPDTDTTKKQKVAAATKAAQEKKAAIAEVDEVKAALLEGLKTAKGILASGSATVQVISAGVVEGQATRSDLIATKISELTAMVLEQDDLPTLCFQLLTGSRASGLSDPSVSKLRESCASMVDSAVRTEANGDRWKWLNQRSQPGRFPGIENFTPDLTPPGTDKGLTMPEPPTRKR